MHDGGAHFGQAASDFAQPGLDNAEYSVGRWQVDAAARTVTDGAISRRLSPRAIRVLTTLAEADGHVVCRNDLMDRVWPDVHVGEESLTQAVTELRRVFGDKRSAPQMIETVQKSGYRLRQPVRWPAAAPEIMPATPDDGDDRALEAHLQVLEAQRLARSSGFRAGADILGLIEDAADMAPNTAAVLAEYAVLLAALAVHNEADDGRLEKAHCAANRAASLRPGVPQTQRALGYTAGALGYAQLSKAAFGRAITLDPSDPDTYYVACQAHFCAGEHNKALLLAERSAALRPEDYRPLYIAARSALALGDTARARMNAEMCVRRTSEQLDLAGREPRVYSTRRAAEAMLGRYEAAARLACSQRDPMVYFYDAAALAHAGDVDGAIDTIEELFDTGWRYLSYLRGDPLHGELSAHPRYRKLTDPIMVC
ncbi:MAG: winged helix-turn-helix domain-containing protein [Pseudomonadota bacterium]